MALINCSECNREVSSLAMHCPHCGAPISEPPPAEPKRRGGIWKWLLGVPVGAFVLVMIIGSCAGDPGPKQQARSAIDLCWQDQKRKSLDPGTARFVASTCERMEAEFRNKFGVSP